MILYWLSPIELLQLKHILFIFYILYQANHHTTIYHCICPVYDRVYLLPFCLTKYIQVNFSLIILSFFQSNNQILSDQNLNKLYIQNYQTLRLIVQVSGLLLPPEISLRSKSIVQACGLNRLQIMSMIGLSKIYYQLQSLISCWRYLLYHLTWSLNYSKIFASLFLSVVLLIVLFRIIQRSQIFLIHRRRFPRRTLISRCYFM